MIVIVRYFISDIIFDDYFNTISFNSGKMREKKKGKKVEIEINFVKAER